MSYRLITKAQLTIGNTVRTVECRAYPAPKRDAAGKITVDGVETSFKRTGGKGRGTTDNRYMYATVKGAPAFWAITEAEATALGEGAGAHLMSLTEEAKPDVKAQEAAADAPKSEGEKAPRRTKKGEAVAA